MRFHEAVPRAAKILVASKGLRNLQPCGSWAKLSNIGFRLQSVIMLLVYSVFAVVVFFFSNLSFWVSTLVTGSMLFAAAFWIKRIATRQESSHSRPPAIINREGTQR